MGYTISLTSVPHRYARLQPVLLSLLRQRPEPDAVILCLPDGHAPDVPRGVEIYHQDSDIGPGLKIRGCATGLMLYCDDDWIYGQGWASALLNARHSGEAVTGQGFSVARSGRTSPTKAPYVDIAQGFSGVLLDAEWIVDARPPQNEAERVVDDIWISAHLAGKDVRIRQSADARAKIYPAFDDPEGRQHTVVKGLTRAQANARCAASMAERYGIWPAV